MIKLTQTADAFYINPAHIVCMYENDGQTSIWTVIDDPNNEEGQPYKVDETPEEILKLIDAHKQNV